MKTTFCCFWLFRILMPYNMIILYYRLPHFHVSNSVLFSTFLDNPFSGIAHQESIYVASQWDSLNVFQQKWTPLRHCLGKSIHGIDLQPRHAILYHSLHCVAWFKQPKNGVFDMQRFHTRSSLCMWINRKWNQFVGLLKVKHNWIVPNVRNAFL